MILFVLQYVLEELNIRSLVPCNDTLKYASLRAEPDFRYAFHIHLGCLCPIYARMFHSLVPFFFMCIYIFLFAAFWARD